MSDAATAKDPGNKTGPTAQSQQSGKSEEKGKETLDELLESFHEQPKAESKKDEAPAGKLTPEEREQIKRELREEQRTEDQGIREFNALVKEISEEADISQSRAERELYGAITGDARYREAWSKRHTNRDAWRKVVTHLKDEIREDEERKTAGKKPERRDADSSVRASARTNTGMPPKDAALRAVYAKLEGATDAEAAKIKREYLRQ